MSQAGSLSTTRPAPAANDNRPDPGPPAMAVSILHHILNGSCHAVHRRNGLIAVTLEIEPWVWDLLCRWDADGDTDSEPLLDDEENGDTEPGSWPNPGIRLDVNMSAAVINDDDEAEEDAPDHQIGDAEYAIRAEMAARLYGKDPSFYDPLQKLIIKR